MLIELRIAPAAGRLRLQAAAGFAVGRQQPHRERDRHPGMRRRRVARSAIIDNRQTRSRNQRIRSSHRK